MSNNQKETDPKHAEIQEMEPKSSQRSLPLPKHEDNSDSTVLSISESQYYPDDDLNHGEISKETGVMKAAFADNADRSPADIALSMDIILEEVLARCDFNTLLNCRLVSSRWSYLATKELQKISQITFNFGMTGRSLYVNADGESRCAIRYGNLFFSKKNRNRSHGSFNIQDLTILLNNSTEFPCNSLSFPHMCHLYSNDAYTFFKFHGAHVKNLELCANYMHLTEMGVDIENHILFQDLKIVLLKQTPNLESLIIKGGIVLKASQYSFTSKELINENQARKLVCLPPLDFECSSKLQSRLKLRSLSIDGHEEIPEEILQEVVQSCPNLIKLDLNVKNLGHFQKLKRMDLLNDLTIDFKDETLNILESLLAYCRRCQNQGEVEEKIQLTYLTFNFQVIQENSRIPNHIFEKWALVVSAMLESSSNTLKKLVLSQTNVYFLDKLKLPKMPKVRQLSIIVSTNQSNVSSNENIDTIPTAQVYFPKGMKLQDTFPNLKKIEINKRRGNEDNFEEQPFSSISINFREFIIGLFPNSVPMPTVSEFNSGCYVPRENSLDGFQTMFPNAKLILNNIEEDRE